MSIVHVGLALLFLAALLVLGSCDSTTDPGASLETYVLDGRVSSESGDALPGIRVELARGASTQSAITGEDGRYRFSGLEAGVYSLSVHPPAGTTAEALSIVVELPSTAGPHDFVFIPIRDGELHASPGTADSIVLGSGVRARLRHEGPSGTIRMEIVDLTEEPSAAAPGSLLPVMVRGAGG